MEQKKPTITPELLKGFHAAVQGEKEYFLQNVEMTCLSRDNKRDSELATIQVGDIDIYFSIKTNVAENEAGTRVERMGLTKLALKQIGVTTKELEAAVKSRTNVCVMTLNDKFRSMNWDDEDDVDLEKAEEMLYFVRVDGDDVGGIGATAIRYDKWKKELAAKLGVKEFFIIPASIDELIVYPAGKTDRENIMHTLNLTRILQEMNEEMPDNTKALSDHLYLYEAETERTLVCRL